jgi:hypothetical protein
MITVKLEEIVNGAEALKTLANKSLKGKTAYRVSRLLRELEKEFSLFNDTRGELIKKYGEKDENGELKVNENSEYTIAPENIQAFYNEINEILGNEVEINGNKIPLAEIGELDFTPNEMIALEPFIEE